MLRSQPLEKREACDGAAPLTSPLLGHSIPMIFATFVMLCRGQPRSPDDAATAGENTASVSLPTLSGRKPDVYSRDYCVVVVVVFIDVATYPHPLLRLILDAVVWQEGRNAQGTTVETS